MHGAFLRPYLFLPAPRMVLSKILVTRRMLSQAGGEARPDTTLRQLYAEQVSRLSQRSGGGGAAETRFEFSQKPEDPTPDLETGFGFDVDAALSPSVLVPSVLVPSAPREAAAAAATTAAAPPKGSAGGFAQQGIRMDEGGEAATAAGGAAFGAVPKTTLKMGRLEQRRREHQERDAQRGGEGNPLSRPALCGAHSFKPPLVNSGSFYRGSKKF